MVQTIQASLVKLSDLKNKFGLTLVRDSQFFPEWLKKWTGLSRTATLN